MYQFLLMMQVLGIILSGIVIFYVLQQPNTRIQSIIVILCIATLVNMTGYLFEMMATDRTTALMAVKMIYLGKPFIILSMLFIVLEYFHKQLPMWGQLILILIHATVTGLVFFCEKQTLYYSSISFTEEGLFPHLVFGHGIVYWLYTGLMGVYLVVMLVLLYAERKRLTEKKQKQQVTLLYLMVLCCFIGVLIFFTGITKGYDSTAFAYLISTILISLALHRYNLIDPLDLVKDKLIDQMAEGAIVLGQKDKVLFINETADKLIREMAEKNNGLHVVGEESRESSVERKKGEKQKSFARELRRIKSGGELKLGERAYGISTKKIEDKGTILGTLYIINDITEHYNYEKRLAADVETKTQNLKLMQRSVTLGLAEVIESRDRDTGGHVRRTSDVVRIFAGHLANLNEFKKMDKQFLRNVINAAPMHDLGKIGVSDEILNKPGRFTPDEYDQMKTHAKKGAVIIERILGETNDKDFLTIAVNIAYYHHERYDGRGYPKGLSEKDIPLEARIMALADVFDALVSNRCYKQKMSFEEAFNIITESLGSHFDPELGREFLECREALEQYYTKAESQWVV